METLTEGRKRWKARGGGPSKSLCQSHSFQCPRGVQASNKTNQNKKSAASCCFFIAYSLRDLCSLEKTPTMCLNSSENHQRPSSTKAIQAFLLLMLLWNNLLTKEKRSRLQTGTQHYSCFMSEITLLTIQQLPKQELLTSLACLISSDQQS